MKKIFKEPFNLYAAVIIIIILAVMMVDLRSVTGFVVSAEYEEEEIPPIDMTPGDEEIEE